MLLAEFLRISRCQKCFESPRFPRNKIKPNSHASLFTQKLYNYKNSSPQHPSSLTDELNTSLQNGET